MSGTPSDIAIAVRGLGKQYRVGTRKPYKTIRETLTGMATAPLRRLRGANGANGDGDSTFWALKDVSFDVRRGEVVGIIGRNGAGKSTLLKVLSRITEPTEGEVELFGRVGSLLEVGTGFHPELTGRENIYLNGAILGMRQSEIARKFDEIVAFAETERFLDTPVKHYSSGMYTRLAFAVAAHLEPEILVVDEVLAVGDLPFQRKCLGKMQDVASHGRTVFFVSHNMSAIQSLCSRCIVMAGGRVRADDVTAAALQTYLRDASASSTFTRPAQPNGRPTITAGRVETCDGSAEPEIAFEVDVTSGVEQDVSLDLRVLDASSAAVGMATLGSYDRGQMVHLRPGVNRVRVALSAAHLALGAYMVSIDLNVPFTEYLDRAENCLTFDVTRSPREGGWLVLDQKWSKGAVEIPARLVSVTAA
jgi:lipopolysaccharide transport system ATP-binding protein